MYKSEHGAEARGTIGRLLNSPLLLSQYDLANAGIVRALPSLMRNYWEVVKSWGLGGSSTTTHSGVLQEDYRRTGCRRYFFLVPCLWESI